VPSRRFAARATFLSIALPAEKRVTYDEHLALEEASEAPSSRRPAAPSSPGG